MILSHEIPEIVDAEVIETSHAIVPNRSYVPVKAMNGQERAVMATDMTNALLVENSAIDVYVMLKNASDVIGQALEIVKEGATKQVTEKDMPILGAKVSTKRSVAYEYEDARLADIEYKIDTLKKEGEERKKMLRAIKSEQADTATGEIIRPAKVVRDGLSLTVTLPQ